MFALYGWQDIQRDSLPGMLLIGRWYERVLASLIILAMMSFVAYLGYRTWKTGRFGGGGASTVILLLIFVQISRMLYHTRQTERAPKGTTQWLITLDGLAIRRGPGDAGVIPWNRFKRIHLRKMRYRKVSGGWWHLRLAVPFWQLEWHRDREMIVQFTSREAALIRGEIRRRWRAGRNAAQ